MLPGDIHTSVAQLQALVTDISKAGLSEEDMRSYCDKLHTVLCNFSLSECRDPGNKRLLIQIDSEAVSLWNLSVARKTSGNLSKHLNAQLRDISCRLVFLANNGDDDENVYRKKLMMAMKTTKAWIDGEEFDKAESQLSLAMECLMTLKRFLTEREDECSDEEKLQLDKDMLKLLCYKAETAAGQDLHNIALEQIAKAKELLHKLPKEIAYISMLCYNFGVEAFQNKCYEAAVNWLRDSYDVGKMNQTVSSQNQVQNLNDALQLARTLRLLSNAYLEWDDKQHWEKAFNAVGLANSEHAHVAGLYMKMKILMQGNTSDDRIKAVLEDVLCHSDLTLEFGINVINLMTLFNRADVALDGLQQLSQKYKAPSEHAKLSVSRLEVLLEDKRRDAAMAAVEEAITGHNTGDRLDIGIRRQFHLLLWEQAAIAVEAKDHTTALQWYNYSLSLFSPSDEHQDSNVAKLHRNRALCFLVTKQLPKALEAVESAKRYEPESAYTHFMWFKILLLTNDHEQAKEALKTMTSLLTEKHSADSSEAEADPSGLICLAAQMAFESNNHSLAIVALENLVNNSNNGQQILTALRCLVRMRLSDTDKSKDQPDNSKSNDSLISYLKKAYEYLSKPVDGVNAMNEATWFMKLAWNLALQTKENCVEMTELFSLCRKLSGLCGADMSSLIRQRTCLLMAAAACLQAARSLLHMPDRNKALEEALTHINDCRSVCKLINEAKTPDAEMKMKDTASVLLMLYEFEARLKLGHPNVDSVLEMALSMPHTDTKTFETLAALSMEGPVQNRSLSLRMLKVALRKHLQADNIDLTRCSLVLHSLVQLSLDTGSSGDPTSKEEAWSFYMEVIDILENKSKGAYPEMEVLWLMTKAWNCGIHLYMAEHFLDAERWCGLAMRLLNHLATLRPNYQMQMTNIYGEILAKIDNSKMAIGQTCCK